MIYWNLIWSKAEKDLLFWLFWVDTDVKIPFGLRVLEERGTHWLTSAFCLHVANAFFNVADKVELETEFEFRRKIAVDFYRKFVDAKRERNVAFDDSLFDELVAFVHARKKIWAADSSTSFLAADFLIQEASHEFLLGLGVASKYCLTLID